MWYWQADGGPCETHKSQAGFVDRCADVGVMLGRFWNNGKNCLQSGLFVKNVNDNLQ